MSIVIHIGTAVHHLSTSGAATTAPARIRKTETIQEMGPGVEQKTADVSISSEVRATTVVTLPLSVATVTAQERKPYAHTPHPGYMYPGCFGLPYQDHNYGAPPPPSPPVSPIPKVNVSIDEDTNFSVTSVTSTNNYDKVQDETITRCICGFNHDDEYMICCDKCCVWQHVDCMGLDRSNIPDTYLCEKCEPRKVNKQKAKALQARKKEQMSDSSSDSGRDGSKGAFTGWQSVGCTWRVQNGKSERNKTNKKLKTTKSKSKSRNSSIEEEAQDAWDVSVNLRDWIDRYEEAMINHYTPEVQVLAGSLRFNAHHNEVVKKASDQLRAQMCKIAEFSISQRGLVAVQNLKKEQAIIEYRGRFMTLSQFKEQYPFFRIRYFPFVLFHKPQADEEEICVDAREYGNAARFIRRSCTPNAKVRHVIQNGLLHLYIFSSKDIKKDQEITIPFDFDYQENNLTVDCPCGKQNCAVTSLVSPKDKQNTECSSLDNTPKRKTRKNSVYIENQSQSKDAVLDTSVSLTHKGTPLKNCAAISLPQDENTLTEVSLVKDETGEVKQDHVDPTDQCVESRKKMTREERKLDAIMRAFERMEKSQKKKQQAREKISLQKPHKQQTVHDEDKTKHHLNGEEEESTPVCENKYDVKRDQFNGDGLDNEEVKPVYYSPPIQHAPPYKRGKKRRSSGSATRRRIRTSSGGSEILSPDEGSCAPMDHFPNAAVTHPCGTLISPDGRREGFVLPKSKRFLMNEWIQEKAEASVPVSCPLTIHTELSWDLSTASPTCYVSCTKDATSGSGILAAHLRRNSNSGVSSKQISSIGSAKKRWLRQAMCETLPQDIEGTDGHESETSHCSPVHNGSMSPNPQSEASSPCLSPSGDVLTPLKKRRMMRASKDSTCSPILDDHPQVSSPESSFGTLRESFKPTLCGIKRLASDCSEHLTNKLPGKWLDKEANVKRELRLEKPGEENSVGPSLLTNCAAISQVSSGTESSQDSCKCLDLSCDVHGVIADSTTATAVDGVRSDVCNSLEKVLEAYNTSVGEADDTLWQSVDRPAACISGENMSKCDFSRDDKCLSTKYDNAGAENISLSLKDTGEKISVCVSPNACYVQETKISAKSDFLEICYTDHNCSSGVDEYVTSSVTPITSKIVSLCSISSSDVISSDTSSSVLSHPIESVSSSQDLPATTKTRSHKTGQKRKVSLSEYRMRKRENTKNESNNLKLETHGKRDFQNNEANETGVPSSLLPLAQFEPLLARDATEIDFKVLGPGKTPVPRGPNVLTSSTVFRTNDCYITVPPSCMLGCTTSQGRPIPVLQTSRPLSSRPASAPVSPSNGSHAQMAIQEPDCHHFLNPTWGVTTTTDVTPQD